MKDWTDSALPRAKAEDDALRAEERFRSAQRMETLARLAGGAAHDFNNVLAAILGHATLAEKAESDAARTLALDEIQRAAERGAYLTRQLLRFARLPEERTASTDLNEAISGTERLLRPLLTSGIQVDLDLDPLVPEVGISPRGVEQVIMNLVVNARDAMRSTGTLTIRTEASSDAGPVLTVQDTGSGIDEATLGRIFEPLFTTKSEEQGTGLGLSTVRSIVEESGGRIDVASAVGVGTTFRVLLPRKSCAHHSVTASRARHREDSSSGIHVGRSATEARAASDVGTPQAVSSGPRFLPTVRDMRTSHWSRFSSSDRGRAEFGRARYSRKTLRNGSHPNASMSCT